jgi:SulP family sulfate permease
MTVAVTLGIRLAVVLFIRRSITLTSAIKVESLHISDGELPDNIVIYDSSGPLFFGSAQKAWQAASTVTRNLRVVILDMTEVNILDISAIVAMESIKVSLARQNIGLVISRLQERMVLKLNCVGTSDNSTAVYFNRTPTDAITIAKNRLGSY